METIQAGAKAWLEVSWLDKNDDPATPISASYKVYCSTTDTLIRDTTALTPASSIEIEMAATDTAMQSASNKIEVRKVCVSSNFGTGDDRLDIYRFKVLRTLPCS